MVKSPFIIFKNGRISPGGAYDGEKIPGDLGSMNVLSSDANEVLGSSYGLLSKRSGTLYHTYGPVRAAVNKQTDYAIGPGLAFRSQPDWSLIPGMDKESAKSWGKDFQKIIHYYFQVMEYYEKQQTLFRGALTFGDTIQIFERIGGELNDIIDFNGDHIDCDYNDSNYFLGIKHDKYLRAKGIRKVDDDLA